MRGIIHAHSFYSFDSLLPPWAYLRFAIWHKLDFLCITDHNTLAGSRALARMNRCPRLQVVIGAEYATDRGDVIGLFVDEDIPERRFERVTQAIHDQGGLVLLPHPYRGRDRVDDDVWSAIDAVEVFNSRSSQASNRLALEQALAFDKPRYAGADIHTLWELLRNATFVSLDGDGSLRQQLLVAPRRLTTRATSRHIRRYSQVIKRIRRRAGFPGHQ
jgi:predicted metal-dependent phosphoesterase TrpH